MNNSGKKLSLGTVALLALYSIITLVLCEFKGDASFWVSFAYMCLALLLVAGISFYAAAKLQTLRDWIFSLPIIRWCVLYVCLEFVMSLMFMILPIGWKLPFIAQLLVFVMFGILVGPSITQRKYVEQVHDYTTAKVSFTRILHARSVALMPRVEDAGLKTLLSETVELLRHSDPMSHTSLNELETKITNLLDTLEAQIKSNDAENAKITCKELNFSITERNQVARAMKLSQY